MSSFIKIFSEVNDILKVEGQEQNLKNIDITIVNVLVNFVAPFHEATKPPEREQYPTVCHVYQWHAKCKNCMVISNFLKTWITCS